jgi:hypothetical protein
MFNKNLDTALWLALIIGKVASARGVSQREAFAYLSESGAFGFLVRNYKVEHLENPLNVIEDIEQFVFHNHSVPT